MRGILGRDSFKGTGGRYITVYLCYVTAGPRRFLWPFKFGVNTTASSAREASKACSRPSSSLEIALKGRGRFDERGESEVSVTG